MKSIFSKTLLALLVVTSSKSFAQNETLPYNRTFALSYSQRELPEISAYQKRINTHYYFIEKKNFQSGIMLQGIWFKDKTDNIQVSTKVFTLGVTNNVYILPFFDITKSRFEFYVPIDVGIGFWPSNNLFTYSYEYGIGGRFHVLKNFALYAQITNTAFSRFVPFYTL